MKKSIFAVIFIGLFMFSSTAWACWSCNTYNNYEVEGGDATAKVYNENENTNKNYNTNLNKNINFMDQDQKQAQGQLQGQDQVQGQKQSADNKGNTQTIIFEDETDYDHINAPVRRTDSELRNHGDANDIKTVGNIDSRIIAITHIAADRLGKDTKDFEDYNELLFVKPFATSMIRKGEQGRYMGTIVLVPTGRKCTKNGLTGRAYAAAMNKGATNYTLEYRYGKYLEGAKAGIDFGTAASISANNNGSAMIAPGSTLGYSKAWSSNEMRPSVIITLFFDETLKITPHITGSDGYSKVNHLK